MTRQPVSRTNPQFQGDTPLVSGILQRAAVRHVPEKDVQQTIEAESATFKESGFDRDFSQIPVSTSEMPIIQPKLKIGAVGDKYEQEADRVASLVVGQINAPTTKKSTQGKSLQRQEENEDVIQAKSIIQRREAIASGDASTNLESAINRARGGGQPLDVGLQQSMGQGMGADFSGVRVHTDATSDQLNQSIQAKAFTTGQDVFFRQGAYEPGSRGGQELIAHELTHVVQQNGWSVMRDSFNKTGLRDELKTDTENLTSSSMEEVRSHDNATTGIVKNGILQPSHTRDRGVFIQRRIGHGGAVGKWVKPTDDKDGLRATITKVNYAYALPKFGRNYQFGFTRAVKSYNLQWNDPNEEQVNGVDPMNEDWELLDRVERKEAAEARSAAEEVRWEEEGGDTRGFLATSTATKLGGIKELAEEVKTEILPEVETLMNRLRGGRESKSTAQEVAEKALAIGTKIAKYVPGAQLALPVIEAINIAKSVAEAVQAMVKKAKTLSNPDQEPLMDPEMVIAKLEQKLNQVGELISGYDNSEQPFVLMWEEFTRTAYAALTAVLVAEKALRDRMGGGNDDSM